MTTPEDFLFANVVCSCGEPISLPYPRDTASPVSFKTWCVGCGAIVEGTRLLEEHTIRPYVPGKPTYLDISLIRTRAELPAADPNSAPSGGPNDPGAEPGGEGR